MLRYGNYLALTAAIALVLALFTVLEKVNAASGGDKPGLFVDSQWLQDNLADVSLMDARSEKDYRTGHIPGAVSAPWQNFTHMENRPGDLRWGVLLPADQLSDLMAPLGVETGKPVIVYARTPGWGEDGRFAWMAMMARIRDVRILDGGIDAWMRSGGEISRNAPAPLKSALAIDSLDEGLTATTDWIRSSMGRIRIVDTRTRKEYEGAKKHGEARGGRLPGSVLVPFRSMFNGDGTVKSVPELRQMFLDAGLTPEDEIVTYCTAGIRSAHMALMLRMTGFSRARNYDASFYEWAGRKDLPLER